MGIKEMALRAIVRGFIILIFFLPTLYILTGMKEGLIDGRHFAVWGLMMVFVICNGKPKES